MKRSILRAPYVFLMMLLAAESITSMHLWAGRSTQALSQLASTLAKRLAERNLLLQREPLSALSTSLTLEIQPKTSRLTQEQPPQKRLSPSSRLSLKNLLTRSHLFSPIFAQQRSLSSLASDTLSATSPARELPVSEEIIRERLINAYTHDPIHFKNTLASIASQSSALALKKMKSPTLKALLQFQGEMPEVNWHHIVQGETINGRHTGYHTRAVSRRPIKKIVREDEHGCYEALYAVNSHERQSSFFPDNWDLTTLTLKLAEAYANPVQLGNAIMIGKTSEGILIKFCFTPEKYLAQGKPLLILTAYPLVETF